ELFSPSQPIPEFAQCYHLDSEFGRLRVEGPNPVQIERLTTLHDVQSWFPSINDQVLRQALALPHTTLKQAIQENRLFICNYRLNQEALLPKNPDLNRDSRWRSKYLPAPRVLFFDRDCGGDDTRRRELIPVAIFLDQKNASAPNPLYIRGNDRKWTYAKTFAQAADLNTQVLSSHLFRCHFVAEPFALSTPRQLAPSHPLNILLEPHLRFTLTVNDQAFKLLKVRGKVFDNIYAGTIAETRELMIQSYHKWTFRDLNPTRDFATRGVLEYPEYYPYRDDILLYWPVIHAFVSGYLSLYYSDDSAIEQDSQLQRWIAELIDPQKGNVNGLLNGEKLDSVAELTEILTILLFTAGPQHAAVHYPQTDYFTFIPAYPGAPYAPPSEQPTSLPPGQLLDSLPPIERAAEQFQTNQIANYRFDRFGHYDHYRLGRVRSATQIIADFQAGLQNIEVTITARNQTRARPYTYLLPTNVPNSINI
ncbi:MAG: lipoxygenase family protein, partial [Nannocystaceae bacterium]